MGEAFSEMKVTIHNLVEEMKHVHTENIVFQY